MVVVEIASHKCTACLPGAHLGSLAPVFCLSIAVGVRVPQDEGTQLYKSIRRCCRRWSLKRNRGQSQAVGLQWSLPPLLSFPSKHFSILVLINHRSSSLHLSWMRHFVVWTLVLWKGLSSGFSLDILHHSVGTSCSKVLSLSAQASEGNEEVVDGSSGRYLWGSSAFDFGLFLFDEPQQKACLGNVGAVLL